MFLTALLSLATAAAPAADPPAAAAPIKLAAPGLSAVNLDDKVAAFLNDHLAQQYTLRGIRVTTPTEISAFVGVERQKQLVGCSETSSSCIAEIADALGVDGVITGSIGKFGSTLQLNVKILRTSPGDMLDVLSLTASSEEQLLRQISEAAARSANAIAGKLNRRLVSPTSANSQAQSGWGTSPSSPPQPGWGSSPRSSPQSGWGSSQRSSPQSGWGSSQGSSPQPGSGSAQGSSPQPGWGSSQGSSSQPGSGSAQGSSPQSGWGSSRSSPPQSGWGSSPASPDGGRSGQSSQPQGH